MDTSSASTEISAANGWFMISDLHVKKEALARNATTFDWIKKEFYERRPKHVLFLGDIVNHREHISWDTLYALAGFLIDAMIAAPWAPTVRLLVGNHDMSERVSRTVNCCSILAVGADRIIAYPEITKTSIDGHSVLFIPYHDDQKEIAAYLKREYPDEESRRDTVAFAHIAIHGAAMNCSGRIHQGEELTADSFNGFPYVFMGHFHKHASYGANASVIYIGSPVQHSFAEAGDLEKGIGVYNPDERTWALVRNPFAAQFVSLSVAEAERIIAKKEKTVAGKMVQIVETTGVDKRTVDLVRKGLQDVAQASGVAPERKLIFPAFVNNTAKELEPQTQASAPEILDYAREYVAGRGDWLLEDGDDGKKMLDYVAKISEQLKREGVEDGTSGGGASATFTAELRDISLENFLGVKGKRTFQFDAMAPGVWLTQGKNGAGKTTLIESVVWCLYGICTRGENLARKSVVSQVIHHDTASCSVTVRFTNGLKVHRTRTKAGKGKLSYQWGSEKKVEKGTVKDTQAMLEKILNVDSTTFVNTVLLNASQAQTFATAEDARKKIIDDLLGFAVLEHYGTAMSSDNTRVNAEVKSCSLVTSEISGKMSILSDIFNTKTQDLVAKNDVMARLIGDIAVKGLELKTVEQELATLRARESICSERLAEAETAVSAAFAAETIARGTLDRLIDGRLAKENAILAGLEAKRQHDAIRLENAQSHAEAARAKKEAEKSQLFERLLRSEKDLLTAEKQHANVTSLSEKLIESKDVLERVTEQHRLAIKKEQFATEEVRHLQEKLQDLDRELHRYTAAYRKTKQHIEEELAYRNKEESIRRDIDRCSAEYAAAKRDFENKRSATCIMRNVSEHIDDALMTVESRQRFNFTRQGDYMAYEYMISEIEGSLNEAKIPIAGFLQQHGSRTDGTASDHEEFCSIEVFANGRYVTLKDSMTALRKDADAPADSSREVDDLAHAAERVDNCEQALNSLKNELKVALKLEKNRMDSARTISEELVKARTTWEMVDVQLHGEETASQSSNLQDLQEHIIVVEQLRTELTKFHESDEDTSEGTETARLAEVIKDWDKQIALVKHQISDQSSLDDPSLEFRQAKENLANASELLAKARDALEAAKRDCEALNSATALGVKSLQEAQCELTRLEERRNMQESDIFSREKEQQTLKSDLDHLRNNLAEHKRQDDILADQSKVINRWLKVWKGKSTGDDLKATSFRSFCLERNVALINERLNVNIDILNRDINDAWGQSLGCELDNELKLVETGAGLSLFRMSEGQRKRLQLALFLSIFEVAQSRSAFRSRFLFLDEVFDALDVDGQMAVQHWIGCYSETHQDLKIFVVTHSENVEGFHRTLAGRIFAKNGKNGSEYTVTAA